MRRRQYYEAGGDGVAERLAGDAGATDLEGASKPFRSRFRAFSERFEAFSWPKATAVLITFNEDDFQKLVLNEQGDLEARVELHELGDRVLLFEAS